MNRRLNEQELEQFVHRTLRSLPDRKAPGTLEARVLAELERRAVVPWWHKSFAYWPAPVRVAFLVLASAAAAALVFGLLAATRSAAGTQVAGEVARGVAWLGQLRAFGAGLADIGRSIFHAIPPLWLYGTLGFIAACYATLLGVGAVAFRVFSVQRQ